MYVSKHSLSWGYWSQQWTMPGLFLRENDLFMIIYGLQVQARFNGWFEKKRKDNLQFWFWNWNNCQLCFQFSHPRADPDFCKRDENFASLVTALCLDILCCGISYKCVMPYRIPIQWHCHEKESLLHRGKVSQPQGKWFHRWQNGDRLKQMQIDSVVIRINLIAISTHVWYKLVFITNHYIPNVFFLPFLRQRRPLKM